MKAKDKKKPEPHKKAFDVPLPSGQTVKVTLTHTEEEIERRVKYQDGCSVLAPGYVVPKMRNLKKNGKPVTASVTVRGCRVRLRYEDGVTVVARSCCKPPDVFTSKHGFKKALYRIFKGDTGISLNKYEVGGKPVREKGVKPRLSGEDRKELIAAVIRGGPRKEMPAESEGIKSLKAG